MKIQKQIKGMPGQEKWFLIIINILASQSLKGSLIREKIIDLIKSKINLIFQKSKYKCIAEFNKQKMLKNLKPHLAKEVSLN